MYRRPKFLEILLEIRRDMAHEADYDVDLFAEIARSGTRPPNVKPLPCGPDEPSPTAARKDIPLRKPVKKAARE